MIKRTRLARFALRTCHACVAAFILTSASHAQQGAQEERILIQPPTAAQEFQARGPMIKEVEIEFAGPRSVDRSVILANMRSTVGQPYSLAAIEEDVRNLYATGLFVNLRIFDEPLADGVKVVVVVQPKPVLKQIVVVGADKIKERAVRRKIKSKEGEPLSEQQISADARAVQDYYNDKGFPLALVEYKIDINEQIGRAVVTFTIREDERAFVRNVNFIGNDTFKTRELRKLFETRRKNLFSFINKSGLLREQQFQEDLRKLRDFYQNNGYIDFAVKDVERVFPEPGVVDINITIFEGIQYTVGNVDIEGNQLFTQEQIFFRMNMLEGDVFSPSGLDADVKAISDLYGERGYIDTSVTPQRVPNIESGRMDLLFQVREGPQSFVERIVIQGNNRTKDKVLRRELIVTPGEVYDTVAVEASKRRLENLGYFSKVDVSAEETAIPDRKNMVVTVEEQRTGSVTFGAGFSTVDSLLGFVEITQGNFDIANWPTFTGAGQKFRIRAQYGLRRQDFLISFTEPWFLDRQLAFGTDLFYNDAQFLSSEYSQRRYGAALRLGRALNQFWRVGLRYQFENIELYDISNSAPIVIRNEAGSRTKSSMRANLTYDSRDSLFLTRSGEVMELAAEGAGGPLMGDTNIWKLEAEATKFILLPWDLIYSVRGVTAVADAYNGDARVPLYDRFFVGGSRTVRGFSFRAIGPEMDDEPTGGQTMAYMNNEITYPIIDRVRGAVFVDAGINNENTFDYSLNSFGVGVGMGLRLNLPIGPLRLDLGMPIVIDKEWNPASLKFHFDVGYQF